VWDADTGAERFTLTGHRAQVTALAISCDSCQLASVSEDGSLKIWDLETGKERATLADGLGMLTGVAFSPNGDLVVSAGKAGVVRVWDAASGKPLATLGQGSGAITAIAFGKRGEFAFASEDGNITLLHGATEPQSKPAVRIATGLTVSAHGPVPKENVLAPSAPQNSEHASLPPTAVLPQSLSCVRSLSFSPDGQRIAGSCDDGSIRIWDTLTGQVALSIPGVFRASSETSGVAFSPDGQWLACCCATPHAFKMWYAGPAMERAQALERWHALEADGLLACKGINAALAHLDVLPATERAQALQRWHALEADQLMARKEYKLALSHLDALIDELPQDADLYRRRVAAHRALGNNDAALEDYRRAIAILDERCAPSPENSAHILKLATCCCEFGNLLRNRRKPGEAVDCFTRAIDKLVPLMEVQPEVLGVRGTLTSCYWGRAYALADLGRTAEAIPDWDRTIESTSSSQWQWQVFRGRGTAHSALGNYREAVLDFAAAFQARPQDPHLWQQIVALHRVAGDREEVAAAFREAVRLTPNWAKSSRPKSMRLLPSPNFVKPHKEIQATFERWLTWESLFTKGTT
jgi:tetratricopeptide (TPR) repeat protein